MLISFTIEHSWKVWFSRGKGPRWAGEGNCSTSVQIAVQQNSQETFIGSIIDMMTEDIDLFMTLENLESNLLMCIPNKNNCILWIFTDILGAIRAVREWWKNSSSTIVTKSIMVEWAIYPILTPRTGAWQPFFLLAVLKCTYQHHHEWKPFKILHQVQLNNWWFKLKHSDQLQQLG
jgi:hypothetical protein